MPDNARLDVKVIPVSVNGRHVSTVVVAAGVPHHVTQWPNMARHFPAAWVHDGMGGAVARWSGATLSVAIGRDGFDCALVGTVRGMHYDVRFSAQTPEDAGRRFREVVL